MIWPLRYVGHLEDQVKYLSGLVGSREGMQPDPSASSQTAFSFDMENWSPGDLPQSPAAPAKARHHLRDEPGRGDNEAPSTDGSTSTRLAAEQEVSGINRHTRNVEFYGNSSSVALLSHIQRTQERDDTFAGIEPEATHGAALVTSLHNSGFDPERPLDACSPGHGNGQALGHTHQPHHFSHCRSFLDNYFAAIHYVHPIIDKRDFFERCQSLWSRQDVAAEARTFVALYYSVLSLGALIGIRDDEPIDGISNLRWSRHFFNQAKGYCNQLGLVTNLDMVQCYFLLAKVCQNELSPHREFQMDRRRLTSS